MEKIDIIFVIYINIDEDAANIAGKVKMVDRFEAMELKSSYTLTDLKEDWPAKFHCRLINITQSNLGRISKSILDRINKEVRKIFMLLLLLK